MATKPKSVKLSVAQIEIIGQFNDYAAENPTLGFEAVAKKSLGPNPFPKAPSGRKFKAECKKAFALERG